MRTLIGGESQDLTRRARELDRGLARVPAANTGGLLRALALTFLALCVPPASAAPPAELADSGYLLHAWSTEDGLPENSATAIVQTQDGYLWFGTFNGLVRFNGVTFKVFNTANTPHLPSAGIVNLHADKRDRLWVSTYTGLVMKDGAQWRALGTNEGWAGNYVRTFAERANGDLLITTFDGHVLVAANDRLTELPSPPGERGQGYLGTVDEDGRWWLAQRRFVGFWNGQEWVQALTPGPSVGRSEVACASSRGGGVWVLLAKELVKLRGGSEVSRRSLLQFPRGIWSMSEDSRTNLWICSYDSGLFQLTADGDQHHWTTTDGLGTASTRVIFEDREENLWLGSSGGGLQRLTSRRFLEAGTGSVLPPKVARSVWPARDQGIWIAFFDAGLFRHGGTGIVRVPVPGPKNETAYGLSVLEDRAGRLWYGDADYCWWRNGQESFEKVSLKPAVGASVTALFEDSRGRVWIGGRGGVVVCEGGKFRQIGPEVGLPGSEIAGFGQEKSGAVWVAGTEGVFREENTGFNEVRTADGQPLRGVLCLKADADGAMWMGTRAAGLLRWRHLRLDRVGAEHGLPDHEVRGILEDEEGYFWMPSNHGIIRAGREQLHAVADGTVARLDCQVLDQHDGLPSAECPPGQPTCARDAGGRMWFATQKGAAVIDPARFHRNSHPPPVHVEQLTYRVPRTRAEQRDRKVSGVLGHDEVRLTAPFPLPLRLPPGSYGLEIEYAALSYSAPEKVQYQVRLEGHRPEWEDIRNRSVVRFYQMQPGEYVFRVRASNNDGVWNEAGATLAFSVLPFYWQTLWFQGAMGVLLVAAGGGAVFWRSSGKRRLELAEMERQKKEFAERKQAELALKQSEWWLSHTQHIAHVGSWDWDIGTNRRKWSDETCWIFGVASDQAEIAHDAFLERVHPEDRDAVAEAIRRALDEPGSEYSIQHRIVRSDGSERVVHERGEVIRDERGRPVRMIGSVHDVTERTLVEAESRQLRTELAHLDRVSTVSVMTSALAHEINQPLAAILSNAQAGLRLLTRGHADLDEIRDVLHDIVQDDKRAGEVIRRLRTMLKRQGPQSEEFDLNQVVREVAGLLHSEVIIRKVSLAMDLAPDPLVISADPVQVQQVILNLLLNALDAVQDEPRARRKVVLSTRADAGQRVLLMVRDSGPGIPTDRLEAIFDPFYSTKKHGMGLGLAICRSITRTYGGTLVAENVPDGGAQFVLSLPAISP